MDLFEYQGKQYFARFGIPTSPGGVAETVDEAVAAAEAAGYPVVVKAQVKVGGRGKAGGIKLAADADEVRAHAATAILGMDIKGHVVRRVWVEHASDIAKEYYASFTLDRPNKVHLGHALRRRAASRSRRSPTTTPTRSPGSRSTRFDGLDLETARKWVAEAALDEAAREPAAELLVRPLPLLRRGRLRPRRDQPAHPHDRRPGARPRRQGHPRRQRDVPPPRVGGVRRHRDGGPPRAARQGEGAQLHRPRRDRSASSPTALGSP